MLFKERVVASKRKCATASERKCAADNFLCVWLLLQTFQCFLRNVRLLLKRY